MIELARKAVYLRNGAPKTGLGCFMTTVAAASLAQSPASQGLRAPAAAPAERALVVGSNIYPRITSTTDRPRFDPSSNLLVNTVGARTGLFGAAALEGTTWADRYVPGTDMSGVVQLYSLSTSGNYGAFFGARSSDNRSARAENIIGSISLVVADSDRPHLHWANYSEGYVPAGSTAFRLLINDENSIQNEAAPAPFADPYNFNPPQLLNNLRVDCGIGMGSPLSCTNPLSILNNGAPYRLGVLFGDKSIELIDGAADAVALPHSYALSWYGGPGRPAWRIYSTARKAGAGRLVLSDDSVSFEVGGGGRAPGLRVNTDAITTPAVIVSGQPPSLSGTCPVRDQRGGTTAGAFVIARDCADGTVVLSFTAPAPSGWACFASNLARSAGGLRQTAYDPKSATLAVSGARRSDSITFACTGF